MTRQCTKCGADNIADARFCNQCGNELGVVATEAERRQITVFFADLAGYTAMSAALDPEDVQGIMNMVFAHASRIVEKYGGRIDKFQGDAAMAVFGDPIAHEDDAERAVRAVLELHAAVEAYSPEVEQRIGRAIIMHTGINTGLVVTSGPEFDNAVGDAINVAARLEDLSEAGEILIGAETAHLVEGIFETADHGSHVLKGKAGAIPVTRVIGLAATRVDPSRRQADFVGRHEELGVLLGAVERMRDGESSVITIEAEAGAGKTRLFGEFKQRLPDEVQWLEGRAYAYGENIPFSAIIDLLSRAIGIGEDDAAEAIESKLKSAVADLVDDVDFTYAPLARLYGLASPESGALGRETYQKRLLESVVQMAEALASRAPTVLAFQDLHWADASTVRLIHHLILRLETPVVVLANYRPGFNLDVSGERELVLRELSSRQTGELLTSLLDGHQPPAQLTEFIVARTEGNPFFIEEIVNSLIETETLVVADGGWIIKGDLSETDLPTTIRGVIAARIDRLDEGRRRVLREASVVGREFLYDVVRRVTTVTDELDPSLRDLEAADLIREKAVDPDLEYLFKHALTQDVAYDGLLKAEREQLHVRTAEAIEAQFVGRLEEVAETLAYHWRRSGVTDKAVQYLQAAGRKAMERFALKESRSHYEAAYDLLKSEPESDARDRALVELLLEWAFLAYYEARLHQLRRLFLENQPLVDRVGTDEQKGMWIAWLGHTYLAADGAMLKALETLDEALALGRQANNAKIIGYVQCWRAFALWWCGRIDEALETGEEGYRLGHDLIDDPYVWMKSALGLGLAGGMSGRWDETISLSDELIAYGESSGSARATAMGYITKMNLLQIFDPELEQFCFNRVRETATDPIYEHATMASHIFALLLQGRVQEGRAFIDDQYQRYYIDTHVRMLRGWFEAGYGLLEILEGDLSHGFDRLVELKETSERSGEMLYAWFSEMLLAFAYGEVAMADGGLGDIAKNPGFALRHGRKVKKLAGPRLEHVIGHLDEWGLGAKMHLIQHAYARLLAHQGDIESGVQHLKRAIHSAVPAGDTPWLREAKALLAEWES